MTKRTGLAITGLIILLCLRDGRMHPNATLPEEPGGDARRGSGDPPHKDRVCGIEMAAGAGFGKWCGMRMASLREEAAAASVIEALSGFPEGEGYRHDEVVMGGAVRRHRAVFVDAYAQELLHEGAGFVHAAREL
jgi:hypothetical protein